MTAAAFPADTLARRLIDAHAAGDRFVPVVHDGRRLTMDEAYAVQDAFVAARFAALETGTAGFKIGLTSDVMQRMCGIDRPIHGRIARSGLHEDGAVLATGDYGRLCLEFEIAVRTAVDINGAGPLDRPSLAARVDAVCPAFELVDDRHADYATLDAASLTADNAWNAGAVLGRWQPLPDDLGTRRGVVLRDGAPVAEGLVGDVLGHPLDVVAWIAGELHAQGRLLPAGSIVLTGSIAKTQFVKAGECWRYDVQGLGGVGLIVGR